MATITLNEVEIYLDTRTTEQWTTVTRAIPKGFVCIEFTSDSKCKMKVGDGVKTFTELPYTGGDLDTEDIDSSIATALENYYTKDDTDEAIKAAISALGDLFELKGKVASVDNLPADNNKTGDVYLVGSDDDTELSEYYWTGTMWDFMGKTTSVDLSNYYTKSQIDTALDNKVDKEEGKGLSTNDYTTAEKEKLASLDNYDDTEITKRVTAIEDNCIKSTDKLILNCSLS